MSEFYAEDSVTWKADPDMVWEAPPMAIQITPNLLTEFDASRKVGQAKRLAKMARQRTRKAIDHSRKAFQHWINFYALVEQIRAANIHKDVYKLNWIPFCRNVLEVDDSRVRQLKKAYPYAKALMAAGITDITESDLRRIPKGITPDNPDLATIFLTARGTMLSVFGSQAAPTAAVYNAILDVLDEAAATGGYVDTGDGEMTALGAAVEKKVQEDILQQREYIRSGSKWEEIERKSWAFGAPGDLGVLLAAGIDYQELQWGDEIVVIVRRSLVEDSDE